MIFLDFPPVVSYLVLPILFRVKHGLAITLRRAVSCVMKLSMLIQIRQSKNPIGFFLAEQAGIFANNHRILGPVFSSQVKLCVLGLALTIGLAGCLGPSKAALMKQFDATIGNHKDQLITELGLPTRDCTPLQLGEACEWRQKGSPPFFEGPLEGTFRGDTITVFLDSRGIVCQWRFQGKYAGTQHSASRC